MGGGGIVMPFGLDDSWASAPADVLGSKFTMDNGDIFTIVKNDEGAALSPKHVVKWKDHSAFTVELAETATDGPIVAGVVPTTYSGKTIADGAACYIKQRGIATVTTSGAAIAAKAFVVPAAADGSANAAASNGLAWQGFAVKTDLAGVSAGDNEVQLAIRGM